MTITFYPRNIGMWHQDFDFNTDTGRGITLIPKPKTNRLFRDRDELIGFCKDHGVRLDDLANPFEIVGPIHHHVFGPDTYEVKQWTLLGWIKDSYA